MDNSSLFKKVLRIYWGNRSKRKNMKEEEEWADYITMSMKLIIFWLYSYKNAITVLQLSVRFVCLGVVLLSTSI